MICRLTIYSASCSLVKRSKFGEVILVTRSVRLTKSRPVLQVKVESCWSLQAIHHKVHILIQSSLQACQDSNKGPIQPQALLALCCSLQILEVRLGALPSQPVFLVQWTKQSPSTGHEACSSLLHGQLHNQHSPHMAQMLIAIGTSGLASSVCSIKSCFLMCPAVIT